MSSSSGLSFLMKNRIRLGEAEKETFVEFENAIQRENSKSTIPGGAIHPLNRSNTSISTSFSEHCQ